MSLIFSSLLESASFQDGEYAINIPPDWMQGRTTYGGLSAALCYETAMRTVPDLPPIRSANISFVGPAGGAVTGRASVLRQGKSVSFVEADIAGEKGLATRATFAFGASRESMFDHTFTPPPEMPAPQECEPFFPEGQRSHFAAHFETGLASGARSVTSSDKSDHFIWVRHIDERATGLAALLALADMPPPAVLPMFPEFKPISSMTWMINFLTDKPQSRDGWWLLQTRADNVGQGYTSQDMLVWNRDMELVIAGRQSVTIFI